MKSFLHEAKNSHFLQARPRQTHSRPIPDLVAEVQASYFPQETTAMCGQAVKSSSGLIHQHVHSVSIQAPCMPDRMFGAEHGHEQAKVLASRSLKSTKTAPHKLIRCGIVCKGLSTGTQGAREEALHPSRVSGKAFLRSYSAITVRSHGELKVSRHM